MHCIALTAGMEVLDDDQDELLLQKDEDVLFASDVSTVSARDANDIEVDDVDVNSVDVDSGTLYLYLTCAFRYSLDPHWVQV